MLSLPGVEVKARIYESASSLVYRAVRLSSQEPVILKILKENYPTPQELIRYRTEYQITKSLNLPGCVKAYDLQPHQNTLIMFIEDFGGESLKIWMQQQKFTLEEFLRIAIAITDSLGLLHAAKIIHKDINPSNIIFNPITGQLKLIDFGISTQFTRENPTFKNINILEGTLAYMSPEQTGRMNRDLDYRTDFYSLGITFYELLSNQLPFDSADALELVHCHLAKQPLPLSQLNPVVPSVLSDIIIKLMAKNAEERYKSAFGIKYDLENCLSQLLEKQNISIFSLATQDISDKFKIPQKIYGREQEIEMFLSAFEQVSHKSQLILISGYSGIGKSSIVQELYKPITQKRGYFIIGKFDQYQRNIPYSAVVNALRYLVKQLLAESETQLEDWRRKISEALGRNGQVIIDVIPEVELVTGKQPPVPEVGISESQNRFNLVFQNFIKVFINSEYPLTLFLDDLQWADGASLKLMQLLMSGTIPGLLLIGAYRDNEVSPAHPLQLTVEEIIQSGVSVRKINLLPLNLPTVKQLISDALNCGRNEVSSLAELVFEKTQGNPFFMAEFLNSIYKENLLNFDFTSQKWQWSTKKIWERNFTDNVVELISDNIQKLPENIQKYLKIAACIGNQFELRSLAKVCKISLHKTIDWLQVATAENLVTPLGNIGDVELAIAGKLPATQSLDCKFVHDRIQQAAYSLINEQDRPSVHRRIGRLLLQSTPFEEQEEKIFEIVNQLDLGCELIYEKMEKDELAQLNLIAAKKAKAAAAYEAAFTYLQVGIKLLDEDRWITHYDLSLQLYQESAQIACILGRFEQSEALIDQVVRNAKTELDKVNVYELEIEKCTVQNNLKQGLDLGIEVLSSLGISLLDSCDLCIEVEPESLLNLPIMTEPKALAAMSILGKMVAIGYIGIPESLVPIVLTQIELSIKYGNAPESSFAYATYGVILCTNADDIETGYKYGKLGLRLVEKLNAEHIKAGVLDTFGNHIVHWKEHTKASLSILREAYCNAVETGNIDFVGYSSFDYCFNAYLIGYELRDLERKYLAYYDILSKSKNRTCLTWLAMYLQIVNSLLGRVAIPTQLLGEFYNEEKNLPLQIKCSDRQGIFLFHLNKMMLCYLFGDSYEALKSAIAAEIYLDGVPGMAAIPLFHFYDSLAHLSMLPHVPKAEKEIALKHINDSQEKMQVWANYAPMNYLHKFYLVEAEKAKVLGRYLDAMDYYDQAISLAKEHEYVNEAALAYELAAKFYLFRSKELIAKAYLQEARYCYQLWGAVAKVKDLETRYPYLLVIDQPTNLDIATSITSTRNRSSISLDIAAIMEATEAISGEIVLDKLLSKLMKILVENSGAQTGYLIFEDQEQLLIEAEYTLVADEAVNVLQSISIENCQRLAKSVVSYVARTKQNVVLGDATCQGQFTNDSYIQATQPKSILCIALMNQGKLSAIVYLENHLTAQAFTPKRLEILQLLSGQAAIAITNAKLYTEVKERENRLHQFIDAMPIGVAVHDTTGQITYANQAAHQLSGSRVVLPVTSENFAATYQLYQAGTSQLYATSQLPHVRSLTGEMVRVEDVEIRQSDKLISLEVSSTPILDEAGQIKYAIAAFQDITHRKQAEKLLAEYNRTLEQQVAERTLELQREIAERKQAEAAAQVANQAKSVFLANMSHELRTPLNAILGFAQLMNRFSSLPVQYQEYLGIISRNGEHLLTLINQVLDLSKIEAGRVSLDETDTDFYRLLNDLEAMFRFQVECKGLKLSVSRMPDVPQYLRTDETKLRQVLINLLSNAIKFTSTGSVSVRVKANYFPLQIYFEVEDTGDGIPPEEIGSLFEAFVQTKTGEQSEGTGLGLTIARSFVQLMGGDMTVTSTLGSGTLFKFNIRANHVKATNYRQKQFLRRAISLAPDQPRYRILIVDDRWDNRQLLVDILAPLGFELIEATNGVEAIQMWEKYSPNLVFMDMRIPMMNGYEVTQKIKNKVTHQTTAVIAVTASGFEEEKAVFSSGCDDFIRKPLKQEDIFNVLQKHINAKFIFEYINYTVNSNKDEVSILSQSALADLPTDLLSSFQQAINNLDLEQIQAVLLQIRKIDQPLANIIDTELKNFQYEKLLDFISPMETSHE